MQLCSSLSILWHCLKVKITPDSLWPHGLYSPWNSPDQNTGVNSLSLLQVIFPTQRWNPDLVHCRWILYQLSNQGSPRILGWVGYLFSSGSLWPRIQIGTSCIAGGIFTNWASEAYSYIGEGTIVKFNVLINLNISLLHSRYNNRNNFNKQTC